MIIKNNTNGKEVTISKAAWESMSKTAKAGFSIISHEDSVEKVQIVASSKKAVVAPDSGELKKPGDKKATSK